MALRRSAEVTGLLRAWSTGDQAALDQLAALVYDELKRMARHYLRDERAANTLQTTALVNEVYLRLVDVKNVDWQQRGQFFAITAQMMRRILVDAARARGSEKRGRGIVKVNVDEIPVMSPQPDSSLVALDEALEALLEGRSPPGEACRVALFRRAKRRGDCRSPEDVPANSQAGLGIRQIVANAGTEPIAATAPPAEVDFCRSWLLSRPISGGDHLYFKVTNPQTGATVTSTGVAAHAAGYTSLN